MRRPELSPHSLLHLLLSINEIGGLGELVQHLHPQINGLVVNTPQIIVQFHLVDSEGDTLGQKQVSTKKNSIQS